MKRIYMKTLWHKKDCFGWAWSCADKRGKYMWQNDNDLGLFGEEMDFFVYVTKKIEVVKGKYLYLLTFRTAVDSDGTEGTLPQIKAYLKYQHNIPLTKKEKILACRLPIATGII